MKPEAAPSPRCLVVLETDPALTLNLHTPLGAAAEQVLFCDSGKAALALIRAHHPEAVLLHTPLPDLSLPDLLAQVRAERVGIELLLATPNPSMEARISAIEAGAFDLIDWPYANLNFVRLRIAQAQAKAMGARGIRPPGAPLPRGDSGFDLNSLSGLDPLTGLPDQGAGERRLTEECARALRYDRPLSIALANVDELEQLCLARGQPLGDATLRAVVSLMQGMIRGVDYLARTGPNQLLFVFPETEKRAAARVVERLRAKLSGASAEDAQAGGDAFRVSCSFGVAGLPEDTLNEARLLAAANLALDHASATTDLVREFEPDMQP